METVGKLIAAALICCALSLLLRKQAPELMLALCAVVCALCFLAGPRFCTQTRGDHRPFAGRVRPAF